MISVIVKVSLVLVTLSHAASASALCIGNQGALRLVAAYARYDIATSCFTDKGWYPPVPSTDGQLTTNANFDYESLTYSLPQNNNRTWIHGGVDFVGPRNSPYSSATPVYSISNGKILYVRRLDAATDNLSVIVVEHETGSGTKFSALYGHAYADAGLEAGQYVVRGQRLGTLRLYGDPVHLHFAIYPGYTWPNNRPDYGSNGREDDGPNGLNSENNTAEPVGFLANNYGLFIPRSQLDGVGSLIDPSNTGACSVAPINGFGCNKDDVRLHAHAIPSVGVFQIHSEPNARCDYVTVSGLTRGFIGVRMWNESYPASSGGSLAVMSVFLVNQFPTNIKVPQGFSLISVSTTQPVPVGETRTIRVQCMAGIPAPSVGTTSIASDEAGVRYANQLPLMLHLSDGTESRFLGGNGSLIEPSNNPRTSGFGRTLDYAKTQASGYSEVLFQVYATSVCSRVILSANQGSARARVATKNWESASWSDIGSLALPATVTLSPNAYQIIRVRPSNAASGRITATCQ